MRWYDWFENGIVTGLAIACIAVALGRNSRRKSAAQYHLQWSHGGGTFTAGPLTEAEFDALVTRLEQRHTQQRKEPQ